MPSKPEPRRARITFSVDAEVLTTLKLVKEEAAKLPAWFLLHFRPERIKVTAKLLPKRKAKGVRK